MPTYEYACTECGDRIEVVQSFADTQPTICTVCGGRLRKVFSPVGIVFKGSGFYRNDSRGKPVKAETGGGSNKSDKDKKGDRKSTDSASGSKGSSSDGGTSASRPKAAEKSA
ncbi:MAG TPA: FmdB family zinc ribbon protein [Actinomycetes bacterium]|jgi:putative FmdB family regulatory protein|nr:FmdB family zinc ribbon protein [Actinomycetes bacterium]